MIEEKKNEFKKRMTTGKLIKNKKMKQNLKETNLLK